MGVGQRRDAGEVLVAHELAHEYFAGEYDAARERMQALPLGDFAPRRALERQILLAAAAIGRGDPMTAGVLAGVLDTARREGFLNTVVTTAPQVTG